MNLSHSILALLAVPAVICSAGTAEAAPEAIAGYLPCNGGVIAGSVIRPARDASFVELHRAVLQRFAQLPKEKQEAIEAKSKLDYLMEYDAELWPDKAEYESYTEAWKKTQMVRMADVRVGLINQGDNIYSVFSSTRTTSGGDLPLTIGTLRYDASKNVWMSNNGTLTGSAFTADETFDYGAQTGNEWKLEKKGSLTELSEMLRLTKRTDGKAAFLYYSLIERSAKDKNVVFANHSYTIIFPITSASAQTSRPGQK